MGTPGCDRKALENSKGGNPGQPWEGRSQMQGEASSGRTVGRASEVSWASATWLTGSKVGREPDLTTRSSYWLPERARDLIF